MGTSSDEQVRASANYSDASRAALMREWIAALRSGKYQQGRSRLRTDDKYCCLGVLCVVAGFPISPDGGHVKTDTGAAGYAPLRELLGDEAQILYTLNDAEGKTFPEIADWIEANLLKRPTTEGNQQRQQP